MTYEHRSSHASAKPSAAAGGVEEQPCRGGSDELMVDVVVGGSDITGRVR